MRPTSGPRSPCCKVIDDPSQDIYLAASHAEPACSALPRTTLCGCAPSSRMQVQARARGENARPRISLYGALLLALEDPADDPFTEKVKDFYARPHRPAADGAQRPGGAAAGRNFCLHRLSGGAGRAGKRCPPPEDARRFAFPRRIRCGGISALVRAIDAAAQAGSTGQDTAPGGCTPRLRDHR
ncbi:MAG: hypothetical protein ACLVJH_08730 [Faecalibacterium prausnitzii]